MAIWIYSAAAVAIIIAGVALVMALRANAAAGRALSRINAIEADELTPAPRADWRKNVLS